MLKRIQVGIRYRFGELRKKFKSIAWELKLSLNRHRLLNTRQKVSIIVPVYNTSKFLRQCLDSILNQTYKNIEVVCVNDCSTDNSLDILKEYAQKDSRVIIVDKPVNEGLPQARKSGLASASGQWIQMIDSDDWVETRMIESMLGIAISGGFDMVCCDIFWEGGEMYGTSIKLMKDIPQDKIQRIKKLIFDPGECTRCVWNKLVKKSVYDKIEFPTESSPEDNYITSQTLYYSEKIRRIPLPLVHYRFNENSLTNHPERAKLRYLEVKAIFERVFRFCRENFGDDLSAFEPELSMILARIESDNPEKGKEDVQDIKLYN